LFEKITHTHTHFFQAPVKVTKGLFQQRRKWQHVVWPSAFWNQWKNFHWQLWI